MRSSLYWKLLRRKTGMALNFRIIGTNIMKAMTTITIVMEIITMLNDVVGSSDFLLGLITGGVSSIAVTFASWLISSRLMAPHLILSRDIAVEKVQEERKQTDAHGRVVKDKNGNAVMVSYKASVYRIKLANVSTRSAFDIRTFFRIRYDNHYATIELPYLPYLKRRKSRISKLFDKEDSETYEHHRTLPFRLTDIRLSKIEGYNKPELKRRHAAGVLDLNDFRKEDTIVEFIVMAVDSISGSALRVVSKRYTQKDLDKYVKEGEFIDGQMSVKTNNKTSDG